MDNAELKNYRLVINIQSYETPKLIEEFHQAFGKDAPTGWSIESLKRIWSPEEALDEIKDYCAKSPADKHLRHLMGIIREYEASHQSEDQRKN